MVDSVFTTFYHDSTMMLLWCVLKFDEIPLKIFKCILPAILEPLTHIVNLSLKSGQIPESCKYARVTPISKGGDASELDNYRPISILPLITKCIEFFVNEQLTSYFEENELLTKHQYGFRKNHSTTYLMLDLFDKIYDSKSKGNKPAIIFLDVKKAFDTVDYEILIKKLKFYGVEGTVILWLENYLKNRYQCTKIGDIVPQLNRNIQLNRNASLNVEYLSPLLMFLSPDFMYT